MKTDNNIISKNINDTIKSNGNNVMQLGDNNNCAVLALSEAFEVAYDKAYEFAKNVLGRKHRDGTVTYKLVDTLSSGGTILDKKVTVQKATKGYPQSSGIIIHRKMKISTFIKEYPKGVYYILVRGHALVIKNGVMYDNRGFANNFSRPIIGAWKVK